jgi:hypothetical protein
LNIVLSVLLSFGLRKRTNNTMAKRQKDQTIQWPKDRTTDNTMAKRQKDRQYNDQKTEGQTIQCSKDRRTDNTMSKRQKDREYNGNGTGRSANPSGAAEFTPVFGGIHVTKSLGFCVVFC